MHRQTMILPSSLSVQVNANANTNVRPSISVFLLLCLFHLLAVIEGNSTNTTTNNSTAKWNQIGAIQGQYFRDYSGSAIQMTADASSIAIHSYDTGSFLKGKTTIYDYSNNDELNDNDEHEWTEAGTIKYTMLGSNEVSISYAGDGSTIAIGSNDPFRVTTYTYQSYQSESESSSSGDGVWSILGNVIYVKDNDNASVTSVDLSHDGQVLAISTTILMHLDNMDMDTDSTTTATTSTTTTTSSIGKTMVYQFNPSINQWQKKGKDILSSEQMNTPNEISKNVISISANGQILAIGCPTVNVDTGKTRIYTYNDTTLMWEQMGRDLHGMAPGDFSGKAIALSKDGSTVAIGSPKYDDDLNSNTNRKTDAGSVRIMRYNTTQGEWYQLGHTLVGSDAWMSFGNSLDISMDGNIVAIGMAETLYKDQFVSVYRYEEDEDEVRSNATATWVQMGDDLQSDKTSKNYFGQSISLSDDGTVVAIGSPGGNDMDKEDSGITVIYKFMDDDNDKGIQDDNNTEEEKNVILINTGVPVSGASTIVQRTVATMAIGLISIVAVYLL